jgi:hypothetical protein
MNLYAWAVASAIVRLLRGGAIRHPLSFHSRQALHRWRIVVRNNNKPDPRRWQHIHERPRSERFTPHDRRFRPELFDAIKHDIN